MASHFGSFDGSALGAYVRSALLARNITPVNPWNFMRDNSIDDYTDVGTLSPFVPMPGTVTYVPTSTNELMQIIGNKIFSQTGYYDFDTGAAGAYVGCTTVNYILNIGGTYYAICDSTKLGTSADCITWTTVSFPTIATHTPTNAYQLAYDGSFLIAVVQYNGSPLNVYCLTTNNGGASWNSQNRVATNCQLTAFWIEAGTIYTLCQIGAFNEVASSTNYYASGTSFTFFTNTAASPGNNFKTIILNSTQVFLYYRTNIRVVDRTGASADITYSSPVKYPIVDSDLSMYAYNGGIWQSTDYVNFTQLTTESLASDRFLKKQSQLL